MVPLAYVLRRFAPVTCRGGRYQVYQHRLFPMAEMPMVSGANTVPTVTPLSNLVEAGLIYTGITRRDWRTRLKEHVSASKRGSGLLFHQALRGDLMPVASVEHEVLRVGLTADEAMDIEEAEVERRSLHPLHRNGLNMVPGGKAGLAFIANMRGPGGGKPRPGEAEEAYADLIPGLVGGAAGGDGSAISALWRENLDYRVRVMTGSEKRLSELQIASARIWQASGWPLEKIVEKLQGIDGRGASERQVRRLLEGKTYGSIQGRFQSK